MNSGMFMEKVAPVVAEYTTTFAFGEKALDSAGRWAVNWLKMGFDADSVCQGIREGMTQQILKKDQIGAHYPHLTDLIRACRRNNYSDKKPEGCDFCQRTGYIFVPHPKCIENMEWKPLYHADGLYTIAAWCRCDLGIYRETRETVITKDGVKLKTPTIDHYEDFICQNWQELMAQRPVILGRNSEARIAELKRNRPVISDIQRGSLLPERGVSPVSLPMDQVVAKVAPQLASKPANPPKRQPPATPQQDSGNGVF